MRFPDFGAFVLSLDVELYWGVTDLHVCPGPYDENVRGARELIPRLLELFGRFGVSATWCAVGMLFADSRVEAEMYFPEKRPHYKNARLSAYSLPEQADHYSEMYYGSPLVAMIARHPEQEIGTHTFSHYYCLEAGQEREDFESDLAAAVRIAKERGVTLRSIVFPRNQVNPAYLDVLLKYGIKAYRGPEHSWMHKAGPRFEQHNWKRRAARLADSYLNLSGHHIYPWEDVPELSGLCNVRASRYFRPYYDPARVLESTRLRRITDGMEAAARSKQIFHLWFHPEDIGRNQHENMRCLTIVLQAFERCKATFGMRSLTMGDVAEAVTPAHPGAGSCPTASVSANSITWPAIQDGAPYEPLVDRSKKGSRIDIQPT